MLDLQPLKSSKVCLWVYFSHTVPSSGTHWKVFAYFLRKASLLKLAHLSDISWTSQMVLVVKNLLANAGDTRDAGLVPGLGRSLEVGKTAPLQYSCLEDSMGRGIWQATVYVAAKSQTWLSDWAHLTHQAHLGYLLCHPSSWLSLPGHSQQWPYLACSLYSHLQMEKDLLLDRMNDKVCTCHQHLHLIAPFASSSMSSWHQSAYIFPRCPSGEYLYP